MAANPIAGLATKNTMDNKIVHKKTDSKSLLKGDFIELWDSRGPSYLSWYSSHEIRSNNSGKYQGIDCKRSYFLTIYSDQSILWCDLSYASSTSTSVTFAERIPYSLRNSFAASLSFFAWMSASRMHQNLFWLFFFEDFFMPTVWWERYIQTYERKI